MIWEAAWHRERGRQSSRAELIEHVAKIIAGPDQHGGQDDETWREWTAEAEQIVDLLRPELGESK